MSYSNIEIIALELSFISTIIEQGKIPNSKLKEVEGLILKVEQSWAGASDISAEQIFNAMLHKYNLI